MNKLERLTEILKRTQARRTQKRSAIQRPPTPTQSMALDRLGEYMPALHLDRSKQRLTIQAGYLYPRSWEVLMEVASPHIAYEAGTYVLSASEHFSDVLEQPLHQVHLCADPEKLRLVSIHLVEPPMQDWLSILIEYDDAGHTIEIEVQIPDGDDYSIDEPKLSIRLLPSSDPAA